ncbi:hypothetical protein K435DRAFT_793307 [Dendrothele bispora CBS 962.96]|uniref:Uncharacterized protein n=1 Tax=Dendrothele bispora (strain CBS 962.96) TaxID=1314807 RepID=A0A4V6T5K6_DENBC|nr:hypothetical protein K435DRAFT_793307 [Dendrothele bispora CBS 962.96]
MAKDSEMTKLQGDSNYQAITLTNGPNSKLYKAWKNRRDAATELMMEDTTLTHVRGYEENSAGLWVHLASLYADSGVGAAVRLLREFAAVKYKGGVDDMAKVMGRIRSIADKLERNHEDRPSNNQIIAIMLNSVSGNPDFKDLITTLENSKEPLMIYDVEIALIRRARNLKDDGSAMSSGGVTGIDDGHIVSAMAANRNSMVIRCSNPKCQRVGHLIQDCFREGGYLACKVSSVS